MAGWLAGFCFAWSFDLPEDGVEVTCPDADELHTVRLIGPELFRIFQMNE